MAQLPDYIEITLGPDSPDDEGALAALIARQLGRPVETLPAFYVKKRSLDARRGKVQFHLLVALGVEESVELGLPHPIQCTGPRRTIIVGDGPAGLFCAYQLARAGVACTVIDRGKQVQPRRRDLKLLNARGGVDPESNYCFGEGGAGTYSDGKLYTRSHKRGPVRDVMEILALHGAPPAILTEARPHIGSNLLPQVITRVRERLEDAGVEFRFGTKLVGLEFQAQVGRRRVVGARVARIQGVGVQGVDGASGIDGASGAEEILDADAVVLATGHSARDIFQMGLEWGLTLEPKGFALGVRIEHPQQLINEIQFGKFARHPKLGAASYKLAAQVEGRGVFSFCMCPGGWIVPAMTDSEHLVVNGMSLSKRDSPFANSGLVVGVEPEELSKLGLTGPLGGVELQRLVERAAERAGGGENRAPAVRVTDFLAGRGSSTLPDTSYLPGLTSADVGGVLDSSGLGFSTKMKAGLKEFAKRMHGYVSEEAILVGVETRTSAPVRMVRDPKTLETPEIEGVFLSGEGPGYAGGIISAAVDGLRVAEQITVRAGRTVPSHV
jgi:uncharacterized FAD-dependent dehydrogenase